MSPINQVVLPRYVQSSITETVISTVPIILKNVELVDGRKKSLPSNEMLNV